MPCGVYVLVLYLYFSARKSRGSVLLFRGGVGKVNYRTVTSTPSEYQQISGWVRGM